MNLRQAAALALEALEGWDNYGDWLWPESALDQAKRNTTASLAALRAALAEPDEPVAWAGYNLDRMADAFARVIDAHYDRNSPFSNPINMDAALALREFRRFIPSMKAYAHPPRREPLTDEAIRELWSWASTHEAEKAATTQQHAFARAVERAHGIGADE